ncbi:MAG: acetyl-CoA carboxylase biotin carboxyl carrier protein subunit [Saprospiraceae bacterium]|nr:acetyl-CoA carboxylase biotin carboxyl carrier protein subunit [Saprospiraceae bacterium]
MDRYLLHTENESFELSQDDINALDIIENDKDSFHILDKGQSNSIHILDFDPNHKLISLQINNRTVSFKIDDQIDQLIKKMGYSLKKEHKFSSLNAPMPGLIVDVLVEVGQSVSEGDDMVILEAMKMENIIKAPGDGIVADIVASKGQTVEKNQVIIEME